MEVLKTICGRSCLRSEPLKFVLAFSLLHFLAACKPATINSSHLNFQNQSWFEVNKGENSRTFTAPQDHQLLANGKELEIALFNAVELARGKRYAEANHIFAKIRDSQDLKTESYQSITCSMAILTLKSGDIRSFKRLAAQLDSSLGTPMNIPPSYVHVISLYRKLAGKAMPINTPKEIGKIEVLEMTGERIEANRGT